MSISVGKITLGNGKRYSIVEHGYMEYDTNAWVAQGDCTVTDEETGEELTDEECNAAVEHNGQHMTLFDMLCDEATWTMEPDEPDASDEY